MLTTSRISDLRTDELYERTADTLLRNSLREIHSTLNSLMLHLGRTYDRAAISLLHEGIAQTDESLRLLDNLVTWVRTGNGPDGHAPGPVTLRRVLRDIVGRAWNASTRKAVGLNWHASRDLRVAAGERYVSSILGNALVYVLQRTPCGGDIDISASQRGEMVVVTLSGSGAGPAAKSPQVSTAASGTLDGSELENALIRHLARLAGGGAWTGHSDSDGCVYQIALPQPTATTTAAAGTSQQGGPALLEQQEAEQ